MVLFTSLLFTVSQCTSLPFGSPFSVLCPIIAYL
jgi:hypothetical protein